MSRGAPDWEDGGEVHCIYGARKKILSGFFPFFLNGKSFGLKQLSGIEGYPPFPLTEKIRSVVFDGLPYESLEFLNSYLVKVSIVRMTSIISFYVHLCRMGRRERPGCNYLLPSATMGEYEEPVSGLSHSDAMTIVQM